LGSSKLSDGNYLEAYTAHGNARQNFGVITDAIFGYSKGDSPKFNRLFVNYDPDYLRTKYRHVDDKGRRYRLDNLRNPGYRPNLIYDYKGFKPHQRLGNFSRKDGTARY
jgi:hypothetical protein